MKSVLHGTAVVLVVLVSAWCLLVQVAQVDEAWSDLTGRAETSASR